MKRLIPRSLGTQSVIILIIGLTISQVISVAIYYGDRVTALTLLGGGHIAERVATITRLIEETPSDRRSEITGIINGPTLRVSWDAERHPDRGHYDNWRTRLLRNVLYDHLNGIDERRINVSYVDTAVSGAPSVLERSFEISGDRVNATRLTGQGTLGTLPVGPAFKVSIQLSDSTWLNYVMPDTEGRSQLPLRFILSIALMAVTVITLAVWAMRRLTAPLSTFAQAAERLGVDVDASPLKVAGPQEVRQAARAFNEMQQRIRRFLDDRTQMLAAISHDLFTPITRLKLRTERVVDGEQKIKMWQDLEEMEKMVSSVLSFAREDHIRETYKRIDLTALLQSICDDMVDAALPVEFEHETRLVCGGRPMALKRALTNLIDNAIKYGQRARVQLYEGVDCTTIQIDDDGPGIPESEHENVFAPFYRIERSRSRDAGGTGLGLAVARTIMRAHGGDIKLVNRAEGGLRVLLTLPRQERRADETS